jgi:PAS domain S-box-containing protein
MNTFWEIGGDNQREKSSPAPEENSLTPTDAEAILVELASTYSKDMAGSLGALHHFFERLDEKPIEEAQLPGLEAKYRALVEQLPAVVFMAYLDRGIGEAYVSPQIEATLGFSQVEWLEDPVRWYQQIHPADKQRWSVEASEMFLSGKPLRSAYRVIARWKADLVSVRSQNDPPSGPKPLVHTRIAFDITDLKQTEEELQEERNVVSAILDTVGAVVVVLDREGQIVRFNRACEQLTGKSSEQARGKKIWDVFMIPEERERFQALFQRIGEDLSRTEYESAWIAADGSQRTSRGRRPCCRR